MALVLLVSVGWSLWYRGYLKMYQSQVTTHQQMQLALVRLMARSIEQHARLSDITPMPSEEFAFEMKARYLTSSDLLEESEVWVYRPPSAGGDMDGQSANASPHLPEVMRWSPASGAQHVEPIQRAVRDGMEGTGWYVPSDGADKTIVAWTPTEINGATWVVGISTPSSAILKATGVLQRNRSSIVGLTMSTLVALIIGLTWYRSVQQARTTQATLRTSEQRYRALVEAFPDLLFVLDDQGTFLHYKKRATETLLMSPEQFVGQSIQDVMPDRRIADQTLHHIKRALTTGEIQQFEYQLEFDGPGAGKAQRQSYEARMTVSGPNQVLTMIRNITARKTAQKALNRYAKRLRALHAIDQDILAARTTDAIAQVALKHIRRLIPCQRSSIFEFSTSHQSIRVLAACKHGNVQAGDVLDAEAPHLLVPPLENALTLTETKILTLDALSERMAAQETLYEMGVRTLLMAPLMIQEEIIGMLCLCAEDTQAFTGDHADIATEVATSIAIAIRQARLYEQTQAEATSQTALIKAVTHRVQNDFMAILGLLNAERRYAPPEAHAFINPTLARLSQRIEGLLAVHHMLTESQWSPLPLNDLARQVIQVALMTLPRHQYIQVDIIPDPASTPPSIYISPHQASTMALVLHELVTNTIEHSLKRRKVGHISVRITLKEDGETVRFVYRDDGPGYPPDVLRFEDYNIGFYLNQRLVKKDLQGSLELKNEEGAVAIICFRPVPETLPASIA
ncbi:MAG: PAS domain-containing protein [Chloroflexi bacterium]|nr:PAS domain-containing protein [Chloroflexota bacterium]